MAKSSHLLFFLFRVASKGQREEHDHKRILEGFVLKPNQSARHWIGWKGSAELKNIPKIFPPMGFLQQ